MACRYVPGREHARISVTHNASFDLGNRSVWLGIFPLFTLMCDVKAEFSAKNMQSFETLFFLTFSSTLLVTLSAGLPLPCLHPKLFLYFFALFGHRPSPRAPPSPSTSTPTSTGSCSTWPTGAGAPLSCSRRGRIMPLGTLSFFMENFHLFSGHSSFHVVV